MSECNDFLLLFRNLCKKIIVKSFPKSAQRNNSSRWIMAYIALYKMYGGEGGG
jgi:hypothetical protein